MPNNYGISIEKKDNQFFLIIEGSPIMTASGEHVVCHPNKNFLEYMLDEFQGFGTIEVNEKNIIEPVIFSSYAIFSDQKLLFSDGDPYSNRIAEFAFREPCLQTFAGPEKVDQLPALIPFWDSLKKLLGDEDYRVLASAAKQYSKEYFTLQEPDAKEVEKFSNTNCAEKLRKLYESFSKNEKGAIHGLFCMSGSTSFLTTMLLIKGAITKNQYISAVMASDHFIHDEFEVKRSEYVSAFESLRSDIDKAFDYITLTENPIKTIISEGETTTVEFKSTFRKNLHTKQNDDDITHSCLKTIAAFLNTDGGKLFIGVSDNGDILGIEKDGFPNNDKYQLHLYNLIKDCLGSNFASLVNTEMMAIEDQFICIVKCKKSKDPVFLKYKKNDEEYFIRTGPGTTRLSPSEAHNYIKDKFEE